ncbi:MAG: hypothetical protein ABIA78_00760 [archaeon]
MKAKNLGKKYMEIIKIFTESFKKDPNIIGITLNGSIPRGTGDKYSEIDIDFYVKSKKAQNLPPKNDINVNGVWFDFAIKELKEEGRENWSMQKRWDCKHSKILFEKNKAITNLFRKKVKFYDGEKEKIGYELKIKTYWCISLAEMFVERGDIVNAHLLINESLNSFVDYYFLKNNEFIPHYKWRYYYFQKLGKPSKQFKRKILDCYLIKNYSKKELYRRIKLLERATVKEGLKEKFYPYWSQDLNAMEKFSESFRKGIKYESPWED